jgi:hypothetical protein
MIVSESAVVMTIPAFCDMIRTALVMPTRSSGSASSMPVLLDGMKLPEPRPTATVATTISQ